MVDDCRSADEPEGFRPAGWAPTVPHRERASLPSRTAIVDSLFLFCFLHRGTKEQQMKPLPLIRDAVGMIVLFGSFYAVALLGHGLGL